jgi:hypothetical protein
MAYRQAKRGPRGADSPVHAYVENPLREEGPPVCGS